MRASSESTVITGIGAVSPFGWGAASLWAGLRAGNSAIGPFDRFDHSQHRTHVAGQVPPLTQDHPLHRDRPRRATFSDLFALASAREAVRQARLTPSTPRERIGVFFGSSTGGMLESEIFYERMLAGKGPRQRLGLLASQQYNGPGDAVARHLRVEGPVVTISSACSSAAMAVGEALAAIREGEVDVAVAGGADSLCRLTYAGFNSLRSVDEGPCRPFRQARTGLSLGEGAAVVIIETRQGAAARGARPIAELRAAAASCDAHHMTAPDPRGLGAARAIDEALADAALAAEEIDFVNAHGTGTPLNDASEWEALSASLGASISRIPITSTKALVGHLLGSAGALETVATILCLQAREVHPMPEAGARDPAIEADLVVGAPRRLARCRNALSINLAFGGANAAVVLARADDNGTGR